MSKFNYTRIYDSRPNSGSYLATSSWDNKDRKSPNLCILAEKWLCREEVWTICRIIYDNVNGKDRNGKKTVQEQVTPESPAGSSKGVKIMKNAQMSNLLFLTLSMLQDFESSECSN